MATYDPTKTAANIAKFFGMKAKEAMEQMRDLTTEDREQLNKGICDGTLTY